jgi:hypothetical protein
MKEAPPFRVGDRVIVEDRDYPTFWANGVTGTIGSPLSAVLDLADGWTGHTRMVRTTSGERPYHWVVLDEPRLDGDGDGPYGEAEIAAASLRLLAVH